MKDNKDNKIQLSCITICKQKTPTENTKENTKIMGLHQISLHSKKVLFLK